MGKRDRAGKIEARKVGFREPDLGYYYIVTDAVETEPNFLNGVKRNLPEKIRGRLVIRVKSSKTYDMVDTILEDISKSPIIYDPWIVFDRDQVKEFNIIIDKAKRHGINAGWSNPCIETLFSSYFGKSPSMYDQNNCIKEFEKTYLRIAGKSYSKNNKNIYDELIENGNEKEAIKIHKTKYKQYITEGKNQPSEMIGVSLLYKLLEEIGDKVSKNSH